MSNSLTGDFDVVVEIAVPIVNRVLASQHQAALYPQHEGPTYLHSFVVRVNDVPVDHFRTRWRNAQERTGWEKCARDFPSAASESGNQISRR